MITGNRVAILIFGLGISGQFGLVNVQAQDFYQGKTIRVIVATTPGGGFDAYSRMLTRHMGKYIPGHPAFVVENMPGAGFLIGTNYLYRQAKPDGLTLGNWIGTLVLHQVMGRKGVEFDARKFEYVGAPVKNHDTRWSLRKRPTRSPRCECAVLRPPKHGPGN